MKTFLTLLLTSFLCFYSNASVVNFHSPQSEAEFPEFSDKDKLFEKLSGFLVAANSFVAENASSGNVTESEFRSWAGREFESIRGFREFCINLQSGLKKTAVKIGVDINRLNGVNAVLDYLLGDKDQRMGQIAGSLPDRSLESCYKDYISSHQSCLATAILDGLFEYQDWVSGANFINCLSTAIRGFDECGNPQ